MLKLRPECFVFLLNSEFPSSSLSSNLQHVTSMSPTYSTIYDHLSTLPEMIEVVGATCLVVGSHASILTTGPPGPRSIDAMGHEPCEIKRPGMRDKEVEGFHGLGLDTSMQSTSLDPQTRPGKLIWDGFSTESMYTHNS